METRGLQPVAARRNAAKRGGPAPSRGARSLEDVQALRSGSRQRSKYLVLPDVGRRLGFEGVGNRVVARHPLAFREPLCHGLITEGRMCGRQRVLIQARLVSISGSPALFDDAVRSAEEPRRSPRVALPVCHSG